MISTAQAAVQAPKTNAGPDEELLGKAVAAARNAYAPYSRFRVGAALRARSGATYVGANVENVSFPIGSCAETAALAAARTVEGEALEVQSFLVYAETKIGEQRPCSPCGACRQRLLEFGPDIRVTFLTDSEGWTTASAHALLPFAFRF